MIKRDLGKLSQWIKTTIWTDEWMVWMVGWMTRGRQSILGHFFL